MTKEELEKRLPGWIDFRMKEAIKCLVVYNAPYDDVLLGCDITSDDEIKLLKHYLEIFGLDDPDSNISKV